MSCSKEPFLSEFVCLCDSIGAQRSAPFSAGDIINSPALRRQKPPRSARSHTSRPASPSNYPSAAPSKPITTLSGYYNRSLRRHTDTTAISITYVLRGTTPPEEESSYDDLFR